MASMTRTYEAGLGIYWTDPKAPICRSVYGETIMKTLSPADRRALAAGGSEEAKPGSDVGDGNLYKISCMLGEASQISSSSEQSLSSPLGTACSDVASISSCMSSCEIQTPVDHFESSPQLHPLIEVFQQPTQLAETTSPADNTVEEISPRSRRKSLPAHWVQEAAPSSPSNKRPAADGSKGTTADDEGSKDWTPKRKGYAPTLKTAQRAAARETKKKDSPVESSPIHDVWTMWGKSIPAKAAKKPASPVITSSVRGQTPFKTSTNGQQSLRSPSKASISPTKTLRARPKQSQDRLLPDVMLSTAETIDPVTSSPTESSYASAHSHHSSESSSVLSPDMQTSVHSFVTAKEDNEELQGDAVTTAMESTAKTVRFASPRSGNSALKATRSIGDLRAAGTMRSGALRDFKSAAKPKLSVLIPQFPASSVEGAQVSSEFARSTDNASPSSPSRIPKLALKTRKHDSPSTSSLKKSTPTKYQLPKRKEDIDERAQLKDAESPLIVSATTDSSIDGSGTPWESPSPHANDGKHGFLSVAETSAIDAFLSGTEKPLLIDSEALEKPKGQQMPDRIPEGYFQAEQPSQVLANEASDMTSGPSAIQHVRDLLDGVNGPHAAEADAHPGSSILLEPSVAKLDSRLGGQESAASSVVDAVNSVQMQSIAEEMPQSSTVDHQAGVQSIGYAIEAVHEYEILPTAHEQGEPALNDPAIIYSGSKMGGHLDDSAVVSNGPVVTSKSISDIDSAIIYSGPRLDMPASVALTDSEATTQAGLEDLPPTAGSPPVFTSHMTTADGVTKPSQLRATAPPFVPLHDLSSTGVNAIPYSQVIHGSPSRRTSPRKRKNKNNGRFSPNKPHFAILGASASPVLPVGMPIQARFDPSEHRHWEAVSAHSTPARVLALKPNFGYWQTVKENAYPNNRPYEEDRLGHSPFNTEQPFGAPNTSPWRKQPPPPYRLYDHQIPARQVPWDTGRPPFRYSDDFDSSMPASVPRDDSGEKPASNESSQSSSNKNDIENARPEYLGYKIKVTPCGKYNVESAVEWIDRACHDCCPEH